MSKLLQHCFEFPNCLCFRGLMSSSKTILGWADDPDYPDNFTLEQIDTLIFMNYFHLRCMAANARPRKWRARAEMLLLNPIYKELWRAYP